MYWICHRPTGQYFLLVPACPNGCHFQPVPVTEAQLKEMGNPGPASFGLVPDEHEVPVTVQVPNIVMTNCSFSNIVESPFHLAGDGLVVGQDLRFRNTPTPFVSDGVRYALSGVTYEAPTAEQERWRRRQRKKQREG